MSGENPLMRMIPMFGMIYVINKLDFEDENTQLYCRMAYGIGFILQVIILYLTKQKIKTQENGDKMVHVPEQKAPFGDTVIAPAKDCTYIQYDEEKYDEAIKQLLIGACIISFIHYKWQMFQPLVFQSVMPLWNLYQNQLVQIHLFNNKTITRPWMQKTPFGQQPSAAAPTQTPVTITEQTDDNVKATTTSSTKKKEKKSQKAD